MTRPIRVLYLDHTAKPGGAEITLVRLLKPLDRARVTPFALLAEDGPLVEMLRAAEIHVRVLPLSRDVRDVRKDSLDAKTLLKPRQLFAMIAYAQKIARFARRNRIDIIHTNSLKAHIYGALAGRMARIPVVWHVRDFIDATYLPPAAVRAVRGMARTLPSHIVAVSQSVLTQLGLEDTAHAEVLYDGLGAEEMERFDCLRAATSDEAPSDESSTRNDGAAIDKSRGAAVCRIGMVGRIGRWKGQHVFLEAAALSVKKGRRARFVIVGAPLFGEEEYERELHAQVARLGLGEHVEFAGFVKDVPAVFGTLDVVVHASISAEPFGMVIIEGMAARKPVVASNGGGVPEIIVDGECGLLFPMGDADALARHLETLLDDPRRAREMGEAGGARVRERFTAQRAARQIEAVYARMSHL